MSDADTVRTYLCGGVCTTSKALAALDRLVAERDAALELLREAEIVIFEGVREDAVRVGGSETWDDVREDADEVRWRIQQHLGAKVVNRERFTRIGRAEAAEAERDRARELMWAYRNEVERLDAERDRLREENDHLRQYADRGDFLVYRVEWDALNARADRFEEAIKDFHEWAPGWAEDSFAPASWRAALAGEDT